MLLCRQVWVFYCSSYFHFSFSFFPFYFLFCTGVEVNQVRLFLGRQVCCFLYSLSSFSPFLCFMAFGWELSGVSLFMGIGMSCSFSFFLRYYPLFSYSYSSSFLISSSVHFVSTRVFSRVISSCNISFSCFPLCWIFLLFLLFALNSFQCRCFPASFILPEIRIRTNQYRDKETHERWVR